MVPFITCVPGPDNSGTIINHIASFGSTPDYLMQFTEEVFSNCIVEIQLLIDAMQQSNSSYEKPENQVGKLQICRTNSPNMLIESLLFRDSW
jgi:hypothetical protein